MVSDVTLHIGMHKTGTTSIQQALKEFDDGRNRYARLNDMNHSKPIYGLFSKNRYEYHPHKKNGLTHEEIDVLNEATKNDLERELSLGRKNIIISGEDISTLEPDEVESLTTWLEPRVNKINVIAYVRDPIGFASSALQQYIAGGMRDVLVPMPEYKKRFKAFCESPQVDYVEFVEFDKTNLKGGSVVTDFCSRVGIDNIGVLATRTNESMSLQCAQLIYHFNRFGTPTDGNALLTKSRHQFIHFLRQNMKGEKLQIPNEWIWAGIDKEDVSWLEKKSKIKLMPCNVVEIDDKNIRSNLEHLLNNIGSETLHKLQSFISDIDIQVARDMNVTNLLNFLFASIYFENKIALESVRKRPK